MPNFKLLGDRLEWAKSEKETRDGREYSWADLARACHTPTKKVSTAAMSNWKNNSNGINAEHARPLAMFLGVDPIWLETGNGSPVLSQKSAFDAVLQRLSKDWSIRTLDVKAQKYLPKEFTYEGITLVPDFYAQRDGVGAFIEVRSQDPHRARDHKIHHIFENAKSLVVIDPMDIQSGLSRLEQLLKLPEDERPKPIPELFDPNVIFGFENNIKALHQEDHVPPGFVAIKQSKVYFSAGPGREAHYELIEDSRPAIYSIEWFQEHQINPERVRRFKVSGDSQEPMLYDGDSVLVHLAETNIIDGKLYAIRYGEDLRLKFLSRRLDGTLILRSMNREKYPDEEVPAELANEHITIIGRVRDASGKGGL